MKKLLLLLCIVGCISCASYRWVDVTNDVNVEDVMRDNFPRLYPEYKTHSIVVTKVEQSSQNGQTIYRVTHKDNTSDDSLDNLLWQTVFMPLLLD